MTMRQWENRADCRWTQPKLKLKLNENWRNKLDAAKQLRSICCMLSRNTCICRWCIGTCCAVMWWQRRLQHWRYYTSHFQLRVFWHQWMIVHRHSAQKYIHSRSVTAVRTVAACWTINYYVIIHCAQPVESPGFVARRGKAGNNVIGHSRRTSGPGAAAARWLIVL